METSANVTGMRLDLKQLGDVVQPATLPQCPKCRAVLFTENFDLKLVLALKPFIDGKEFAQVSAEYPSYYALAQIQQHLKAPPYHIGHSYLRASWQAESKPAIAELCLAQAYESLSLALKSMEARDKRYANTALLLGELERRLARFEDAETRFRALAGVEALKEVGYQRVIERQMELIAKRDNKPHEILTSQDAVRVGAPPIPLMEYTTQSLESISAAPKPKPQPHLTK